MRSFNCVLLIDDDGVTNFINHRLVKKMDLSSRIESAINGVEALNFIKEYAMKNENKGPELILLDVNMPVLNGLEFLNYFEKLELQNKENIEILLLTAGNQIPVKENPSKKLKVTYLEKPLSAEKLKSLFEKEPSAKGNTI